jgi:hypothetical protein
MHLFEVERDEPRLNAAGNWKRRWMKRLGGQVKGMRIMASEGGRVLGGTSQGFLLCCNLRGDVLWHKLFERGLEHLIPYGDETLICDNGGEFWAVSPLGDLRPLGRLSGFCASASAAGEGVHIVCGRELWRI